MHPDKPSHTEAACVKLFEQFFCDSHDLLDRFSPSGWQNSPLFLIFHPTPQQRYEEAVRFHENMASLLKGSGKKDDSKKPELADFLNKEDSEEINPNRELVEIIGFCLWDIFSDNHEVVSSDGKVYDTGSFRGSGGFIADYINTHFPEVEPYYDYLSFYMGSIFVSERADLMPIYLWIFEHLQCLRCDWIYSFPRIHLISFDKGEEEIEAESDPLSYDPNKAVEKQIEKQKDKEELDEMREMLDQAYEDEVEEAKYKPLPKTVAAYKAVYGRLPRGWPHK